MAPVLDSALLHLVFHAFLEVPGYVRDRVVAVSAGQHLAIQCVRLSEVVVGAFHERGSRDLTRFDLPTREIVGRVCSGPPNDLGA